MTSPSSGGLGASQAAEFEFIGSAKWLACGGHGIKQQHDTEAARMGSSKMS